MINVKFTLNCPFCNEKLFRYEAHTHYLCNNHNCLGQDNEHYFYYKNLKLQKLILSYKLNSILFIDFDTLQDLISTIDTLIIYQ